MELTKIIKYLDKKFNEKIAAKWDNPGLQQISNQKFYGFDQVIKKVLITLDVNQDVVNYAIENNFQLIISRHPFLFGDLELAKKNQKKLIKQLIENKIILYAIHTNYDASANQNLLTILEKKFKILKSKRIGLNNEGYEIKLKNVLSSQEFINNFQEIFNSKNYQVNKNFAFDEKIKNFKIVTGAGGDLLIQDQLQDCFFVTGEIKWHELIYANDHQVSVLILGHYMENYFINHLQNLLQDNFKELKIETFDIENQIRNR